MKRGKILLLGCLVLVVLGASYGARLIRRGFSATEEPSGIEKLMARTVRNLSIPSRARKETNPWKATPENLEELASTSSRAAPFVMVTTAPG